MVRWQIPHVVLTAIHRIPAKERLFQKCLSSTCYTSRKT